MGAGVACRNEAQRAHRALTNEGQPVQRPGMAQAVLTEQAIQQQQTPAVRHTADAAYSIVGSNETSTYANATPKPAASVPPGATNTYSVQSTISPDVNYAVVRYKIGNKTCVFNTNYVNGYTSGGIKVPSWNKSYTASGGATCTATITSTNISTHAWAVEFTIK